MTDREERQTMYFTDKGEILWKDQEGQDVVDIAKETGFSVERITLVIGALKGTQARIDAIEAYKEKLKDDRDNEQIIFQTSKRNRGTHTKPKQGRNKTLRIQRTNKTLSRDRIQRYRVGGGTGRHHGNGRKDSSKNLLEQMKEHVDYKG